MDETLKQFNPTLLDGNEVNSHISGSDEETGNSGSNGGDEPLEGDF